MPYHQIKTTMFAIMLLLPVIAAKAQGRIYGQIETKDGRVYKGFLRWEDEQALWDDFFKAYRKAPPTQSILSREQLDALKDDKGSFNFDFMSLWKDEVSNTVYSFRCSFGDLRKIESNDNGTVTVTLKNDDQVIVLGGKGGDLDEDIIVEQADKKKLRLEAEEIHSIIFSDALQKIDHPNTGSSVYAKVLTSSGIFEGFLAWDGEERLGTDQISGRRNGNKFDFQFSQISSIQAEGKGSLLRLTSGRTLYLDNHDDVSSGNHGILLKQLPFGKILIDWEDFISAELTLNRNSKKYSDYPPPTKLKGKVFMKDGGTHSGHLIFDLEEVYSIEYLNGFENGLEYFVRFDCVSIIEPLNNRFSRITLKNGQTLILGKNGDVNEENRGIAVYNDRKNGNYVPWNKINSIHFD